MFCRSVELCVENTVLQIATYNNIHIKVLGMDTGQSSSHNSGWMLGNCRGDGHNLWKTRIGGCSMVPQTDRHMHSVAVV